MRQREQLKKETNHEKLEEIVWTKDPNPVEILEYEWIALLGVDKKLQ